MFYIMLYTIHYLYMLSFILHAICCILDVMQYILYKICDITGNFGLMAYILFIAY